MQEKIKKLIVIWGRGNTFPALLLSSFQEKLDAVTQSKITLQHGHRISLHSDSSIETSSTPPGSPPAKDGTFAQTKQTHVTSNDASSILESLANLARQNATAAAAASSVTAQDNANNVSSMQNAFKLADTSVNLGNHFPTPSPSVNVPAGGATNAASIFPGASLNNSSNSAHGAVLPAANVPGNESMQQQMMLLQLFASQGVPPEQWAEALRLVYASGASLDGLTAANSAPPSWSQNGNQVSNTGWNGSHDYQSRDQIRSPTSRPRDSDRSRSRSPGNWKSNRDQSPRRRRRSPDYGDSPGRRRGGTDDHRDRDHGRGRGDRYRERSPMNHRNHSSSPPDHTNDPKESSKKWIDHDPTLGPNRIKGKRGVYRPLPGLTD